MQKTKQKTDANGCLISKTQTRAEKNNLIVPILPGSTWQPWRPTTNILHHDCLWFQSSSVFKYWSAVNLQLYSLFYSFVSLKPFSDTYSLNHTRNIVWFFSSSCTIAIVFILTIVILSSKGSVFPFCIVLNNKK